MIEIKIETIKEQLNTLQENYKLDPVCFCHVVLYSKLENWY